MPSTPSCLSPAWQSHKSASLSARSRVVTVGMEPQASVRFPEIHGGLVATELVPGPNHGQHHSLAWEHQGPPGPEPSRVSPAQPEAS